MPESVPVSISHDTTHEGVTPVTVTKKYQEVTELLAGGEKGREGEEDQTISELLHYLVTTLGKRLDQLAPDDFSEEEMWYLKDKVLETWDSLLFAQRRCLEVRARKQRRLITTKTTDNDAG